MFLLTVQKIQCKQYCFLPWLLGSQSCEKAFRAARSTSSTFSTVIIFGMLGLLRQLHRLQIQSALQAEAPITGVTFPRLEKHQNKDGKSTFVK